MAYRVKRPFKDAEGKAWKSGELYTGDDIDHHRQLGDIEDAPEPGSSERMPPPSKPGGGETGGAPA